METDGSSKQKLKDGYGPVYHRVYSIAFPGKISQVREAMLDLKGDPDQFSPQLLASFEKVLGVEGKMQAKDEFEVHLTGPWRAPVRVKEVRENEFLLETLEGHIEAGEIRFRIQQLSDQEVLFEIESLSRSSNALVDLVYDKIPIARYAQTEMWRSFCKNFAEHATTCLQGDPAKIGDVCVLTERQDEETGQWEKL